MLCLQELVCDCDITLADSSYVFRTYFWKISKDRMAPEPAKNIWASIIKLGCYHSENSLFLTILRLSSLNQYFSCPALDHLVSKASQLELPLPQAEPALILQLLLVLQMLEFQLPCDPFSDLAPVGQHLPCAGRSLHLTTCVWSNLCVI